MAADLRAARLENAAGTLVAAPRRHPRHDPASAGLPDLPQAPYLRRRVGVFFARPLGAFAGFAGFVALAGLTDLTAFAVLAPFFVVALVAAFAGGDFLADLPAGLAFATALRAGRAFGAGLRVAAFFAAGFSSAMAAWAAARRAIGTR